MNRLSGHVFHFPRPSSSRASVNGLWKLCKQSHNLPMPYRYSTQSADIQESYIQAQLWGEGALLAEIGKISTFQSHLLLLLVVLGFILI